MPRHHGLRSHHRPVRTRYDDDNDTSDMSYRHRSGRTRDDSDSDTDNSTEILVYYPNDRRRSEYRHSSSSTHGRHSWLGQDSRRRIVNIFNSNAGSEAIRIVEYIRSMGHRDTAVDIIADYVAQYDEGYRGPLRLDDRNNSRNHHHRSSRYRSSGHDDYGSHGGHGRSTGGHRPPGYYEGYPQYGGHQAYGSFQPQGNRRVPFSYSPNGVYNARRGQRPQAYRYAQGGYEYHGNTGGRDGYYRNGRWYSY